MSEAIVEKRQGISPVWILPILAICLGGWLLFKSYSDAGINITLQVDDSTGITVNKTPVLYKGNQIGTVTDIRIRQDLEGVDLIIEMKKRVEAYLVEDLKFWVEKVDVKGSRIIGLDTILSGNYIGMQLGTSSQSERNFMALPQRPLVPSNAPGLHLGLRTKALNSIDVGSGIYTKNIQVGSVQKYELQDNETILISVFIEPEYQHLVREGTRFWNASGINISGSITDLDINIASIASLIAGGIEMETLGKHADDPQVENGQEFKLYNNRKELASLSSPTGLNIILETPDLGSLDIGSHVYYRRVEVGEITGFQFSPTFQHVLINIVIYQSNIPVIRENTKFWNASGIHVSGGVLSGVDVSTESMEALMKGGIALATPENDEMGGTVSDGHRFILLDEEDEDWRKWSPKISSQKGLAGNDQAKADSKQADR